MDFIVFVRKSDIFIQWNWSFSFFILKVTYVLYTCSSKFFSSFIHFNKLGKKVIELVIDCTASLEYSKLNVPAQLYSRLPSEQQRRLMHLVLNFLLHQVQKRGLGTLAFPFSCADALCWVSLSLSCLCEKYSTFDCPSLGV